MNQTRHHARSPRNFTHALVAMLGITVAGCGSSGDDEGSVTPGAGSSGGTSQFIDSIVSGVEFQGPGGAGFTNSQGEFDYSFGELVSFRVGGIVLGELIPGPFSSPLDMVDGADSITDSDEVLNIVRFLLTLDLNDDPTDGIELSSAIHSLAAGLSIDFAQDTESFEVDPDVLAAVEAMSSAPLVSAEVAIDHFNASMVASRAGSYEGYLEGDHEGLWDMSSSNDGELMMIVHHDDGDFVLFGNSAGDGSFLVYGTEMVFSGRIDGALVTGTWFGVMDYIGSGGTLSGNQLEVEEGVLAFPDSNLLAGFDAINGEVITGSYDGDDGSTGTFTLSLDQDEHGQRAVSLLVDGVFPSALYPTNVTATGFSFEGINAMGATFRGAITTSGEVVGTYGPIGSGSGGGSFSGSL